MNAASQRSILWRCTGLFPFAILSLTAGAVAEPRSPQLSRYQVPGIAVDYRPQSSGIYIGSPSLAVLTNGNLVASHDEFGPRSTETTCGVSQVFRSKDAGQTWQKVAVIQGQYWSTLF